MSVSLKGCNFELTELSVHFESFNDECANVKKRQWTQKSRLTRVNLQLNLCPSKSTTPVLTRKFYSIP